MQEAHRGQPIRATPAGWYLAETGEALEQWLAARDTPGLAKRVPILAYGSNVCPSKITWLRAELGLVGPAVLLRAQCFDVAAVWAAGLRTRDGIRPATLAGMPGIVETHAVWLATAEQAEILDVCEAHGVRYQRGYLHTGRIVAEHGDVLTRVQAYTAADSSRMPLLAQARPVRVSELSGDAAVGLTGIPARSHGLSVTGLDDAVGSGAW